MMWILWTWIRNTCNSLYMLLRVSTALLRALLQEGEGGEGAHHLAHCLAVIFLTQNSQSIFRGEMA